MIGHSEGNDILQVIIIMMVMMTMANEIQMMKVILS